jgi:catechol 2,3-dioxygenase-like lactoylglutathione lyase family enzyme
MMDHAENLRSALDLPALSQIGMVVANLGETVAYYENTLGTGKFVVSDRDFELKFEYIEYRGRRVDSEFLMAFGPLGGLELEFIQTMKGPTLYDGIHHLGFDIDDLDERLARYRNLGIEVLMEGRTRHGGFAYLDTESIGGMIVELIQRPSIRA